MRVAHEGENAASGNAAKFYEIAAKSPLADKVKSIAPTKKPCLYTAWPQTLNGF